MPSDAVSTVRRPDGHSRSHPRSPARRSLRVGRDAEPVGPTRDRALAPSPGRRGAAAVVAEARDAFQALSSEALRQTSSSFLEVAKTQLTGHVAPLKDSLERMDRQMSGMEKVRQEAYGAVTQHLNTLAGTQERLRLETGNLVKALRTPHVRGRWGEVQLRNVVEAAGMIAHCDFQEQASTRDSEGSLLRPDLVVRIPGGKQVVVDAKAPLAAYLDACEAEDEDLRNRHLADHARQVRDHLGKLAQKSGRRRRRRRGAPKATSSGTI